VLDEPMRQQLLNKLFETWISEQVKQEMKRWEVKGNGNVGSGDKEDLEKTLATR
jgi:hypothetical protein